MNCRRTVIKRQIPLMKDLVSRKKRKNGPRKVNHLRTIPCFSGQMCNRLKTQDFHFNFNVHAEFWLLGWYKETKLREVKKNL